MITVARILMKAFIPRIRLGNVVTKGPSIAQEAGEGFTESHQRRDCVRIPKYHPRQRLCEKSGSPRSGDLSVERRAISSAGPRSGHLFD